MGEQMSLTAEQLKEVHIGGPMFCRASVFDALCDMALASLTEREKGYRQGLEAAAKIAIKHPSSAGFDIAKNIRIAELEVKK